MARTTGRPVTLRGLLTASGPLVRGELRGPKGAVSGHLLLDTGASASAVDRELAARLDLPSHRAAEWHAIGDGANGRNFAPLRRARLAIADDPRLWDIELVDVANLGHAVEGFHVIALLGWDFLDHCRLVLDGPARTFSLELPPR